MSCTGNACVRAWVLAIVPALTAVICSTPSLPNPLPSRFHRAFLHPFKRFISLEEAEALASSHPENASVVPNRENWRSLLLAFLALLEGLAWVADASFHLAMTLSDFPDVIRRFLVAFSWIYATYKPISAHPSFLTVPYDLLVIYLIHFISASLELGGVLFDNILSGVPLPTMWNLFGLSANLGITMALLYVTMRMPIGLPSSRVKEQDIVS